LLMHATDYIKEQIGLVEVLEEKGYTYRISDGIYFDTTKFPEYTKLSRQKEEELKAGARVEMTEGKRHATDFALWKFSDAAKQRQMEWESPWGVGFPGWHIECSAMSLEGLFQAFDPSGNLRVDRINTIDVHTGGIDHIAIHHTNEIAQAEAATGKHFVKYWVHHNFLQVNGEKMSKSLGNFYTVQDVMDKGFDPMALRYLYLQTHYRQEMNFTWESLEAAETALKRLRREVLKLTPYIIASEAPTLGVQSSQFMDAVNDDMNTAKALAVVWEVVKSNSSDKEKAASLVYMDNVLGLELFKNQEIPTEVLALVKQREKFREQKEYKKSDELREEIERLGYVVKDTNEGSEISTIK
jgi:cysteinyl-tRNA synthetase